MEPMVSAWVVLKAMEGGSCVESGSGNYKGGTVAEPPSAARVPNSQTGKLWRC